MDIQIPSLAWEPLPCGRFRRLYHFDRHAIIVDVTHAPGALHLTYERMGDRPRRPQLAGRDVHRKFGDVAAVWGCRSGRTRWR
jgi:hypothetical protein